MPRIKNSISREEAEKKKDKGSPLLEAVKDIQKLEIMKEGYQKNCEQQAAVFADEHDRKWGKSLSKIMEEALSADSGMFSDAKCPTYNERNKLKAAERKATAAEKRKLFRKERPLLSWRKLFPGKFHIDEYGCYIFDCTNQMVLHSMEDAFIGLNATSPETRLDMQIALMQMLVEVMGSPIHWKKEVEKYMPYRKMVLDVITLPLKQVDGECIADSSGVELAVARGWGYLTGVKKYPAEKAAAIQDSMIADICAAFNEKYFKKEERSSDQI